MAVVEAFSKLVATSHDIHADPSVKLELDRKQEEESQQWSEIRGGRFRVELGGSRHGLAANPFPEA